MNNYNTEILNKREMVIEKLAILADQKCILSADLGKGESLSVMIVAINLETSTLILKNIKDTSIILNDDALEPLYKKMTTAARVEFSAVFRDIQAVFAGTSIKKMTYKGNIAFHMYIPSSLQWKNRRKYNRKRIPVAKSSFCEIVLSIPKSDSTDEYRQNYAAAIDKIKYNFFRKHDAINLLCLELYDVSLAGCSFISIYTSVPKNRMMDDD